MITYRYFSVVLCRKGKVKELPVFSGNRHFIQNSPFFLIFGQKKSINHHLEENVPLNFQWLFFKIAKKKKKISKEWVTQLSSTFYYFSFVLNTNGHWFIFSYPGQLCHISWLIHMHFPLKDILTESCHIRHLHLPWLKFYLPSWINFSLAEPSRGV